MVAESIVSQPVEVRSPRFSSCLACARRISTKGTQPHSVVGSSPGIVAITFRISRRRPGNGKEQRRFPPPSGSGCLRRVPDTLPLARIHRRETVAAVRGGMRDQGSGWRGPDADEMDDVGRGCRSKEMLTTRSSGAGSDFQRRAPAEAIRSRAWRGWARQLGNLVDRSDAAGVVKKGVAVRAVWPGRC